MTRSIISILAGIGCYLAAMSSCYGDVQSRSYSFWQIKGDEVVLTLTMLNKDVALLEELQQHSGLVYYADLLGFTVNVNQTCSLQKTSDLPFLRQNYQGIVLHYQCTEPVNSIAIESEALLHTLVGHMHFADVSFAVTGSPQKEGKDKKGDKEVKQVQQKLLTLHDSVWALNFQNKLKDQGSQSWVEVTKSYLHFGFQHVLTGWDHIAFLLALLITVKSLRTMIFLVTGFTVGHSITLSLASLQWVQANEWWVEALIGFTVLLVAVENTLMRSTQKQKVISAFVVFLLLFVILLWLGGRGGLSVNVLGLVLFSICYLRMSTLNSAAWLMRGVVSLLFGMIHGLAFSAVLLEVGVPAEQHLAALLGFNLGVELGQILFVLLMVVVSVMLPWVSILLLRKKRWETHGSFGMDVSNAALAGLGMFWFIIRIYN